MASKVTPATEEEGVEVEEAEKEGGIGATKSYVSVRGRFSQSWVCQTVLALMAPMVVKKGESGIGMKKWRRICVIAKGKMSLSWVAVSKYTSRIDVMK